MERNYMAIDQHGQTIHLGATSSPRKSLLEYLGATHADRIYRDTKDGGRVHVGYVVSKRWFTLYTVEPVRRPV